MKEVLEQIGKEFCLPGNLIDYSTIKQGNVNNTYKVTYRLPDGMLKNYIFQKVNTYVFKNPVEIMENIDRVTEHIRDKVSCGVQLHFHHTSDRKNYCYDEQGYFWRVMNYIDSVTFNSCDNLKIVEETGKAFGAFQSVLRDFDGKLLHETIVDFHNTKKRLENLFLHAEQDAFGRVNGVKPELEYIASVMDKASELSVKYVNGKIPVRVTHNDTKCNNVLFDRRTFEPLTIIDLDTVMPGMVAYDFGDGVRFIGNTADEDEPDINKVSLDVEKFRVFCRGFLCKAKSALTKEEIDSLVLGTFSITVELAARFLDDYITGDKYFKTLYPEHNLARTRCQIQLAKDIDSKFELLELIVKETVLLVK